MYESWSYGLIREDIETGLIYIVTFVILGMAGKISFILKAKKKKAEAWRKFTNDDDDDYSKFLKKQREKYNKDK